MLLPFENLQPFVVTRKPCIVPCHQTWKHLKHMHCIRISLLIGSGSRAFGTILHIRGTLQNQQRCYMYKCHWYFPSKLVSRPEHSHGFHQLVETDPVCKQTGSSALSFWHKLVPSLTPSLWSSVVIIELALAIFPPGFENARSDRWQSHTWGISYWKCWVVSVYPSIDWSICLFLTRQLKYLQEEIGISCEAAVGQKGKGDPLEYE